MPGSAQETEKAVSSQEVVVCSVQEAGKVPGSAQEAEMAVDCRGNFKERGEQYRTIWDNMEIGATMICLHLKPD